MKKLKEKIIKKIYKIETKKTLSYFLTRLFLSLLFLFIVFIFASTIIDIVIEQKSLDLLNFLGDDFEVIKKYFFENLINFFQELPQPLTYFLIINISILIIIVFVFIKNFNKIKNKLISIYKFYKKS